MINTAGEADHWGVSRTMTDLNENDAKVHRTDRKKLRRQASRKCWKNPGCDGPPIRQSSGWREANIMLQEVLSGAHENMGALENTLMLRVSEFVGS